jgi:hypothetical protein
MFREIFKKKEKEFTITFNQHVMDGIQKPRT